LSLASSCSSCGSQRDEFPSNESPHSSLTLPADSMTRWRWRWCQWKTKTRMDESAWTGAMATLSLSSASASMNCSSALGELHAAQGLGRGRRGGRGVAIVSQGEHVPHILRERESQSFSEQRKNSLIGKVQAFRNNIIWKSATDPTHIASLRWQATRLSRHVRLLLGRQRDGRHRLGCHRDGNGTGGAIEETVRPL
jgi:hypothetical protein